MTTPTTLADRFAAALDALDDAVGRVDSTAARTAALTYAAAWHEVNGATIKAEVEAEVEAEVKAEVDPIAEAARLAYERGSKVRPWSVDEERTWVNAIGNLLDSVAVGPYGSIVACSGGDDLVAKLMAAWSTRAVETAAVDEARRLAVALATVTKERDEAVAESDRLTTLLAAERDGVGALRADLEAERKAWQEATFCATSADAKAKVERWEKMSRSNLASIDENRRRAEQAEREGASLKAEARPGPATDEELSRGARGAFLAAEQDARARGAAAGLRDDAAVKCANRAVYNLGLAHGRAEATRPATVSPDDLLAEIEKVDDTGGQVWLSAVEIVLARHAGSVIGPVTTEATRPAPTPDASDEEIARALYDATAVPGSYDDLPWSVIEPRQRAGWIAAVTTVIRPRLDALRAEVTRLTEARATTPAFELSPVAWADTDDGAEFVRGRFNGTDASGSVSDDGSWQVTIDGVATDEQAARATVERAVALLTGRAVAAPVEPARTGEKAPAPRYVAVPADKAKRWHGRNGAWFDSMHNAGTYAGDMDSGAVHRDAIRWDLFNDRAPHHVAAIIDTHAVVDTGGGR